MKRTYQVAILLFDYVDALDFAGPYEVFTMSVFSEGDVRKLFMNQLALKDKPFQVFTVSKEGESITAHNGLKVIPDYSFKNCPAFDVLLVPGGPIKAMKNVMEDQQIIGWIGAQPHALIASVCTGSFFLGKAGLLDGKDATTNQSALSLFGRTFEKVNVVTGRRYIDTGSVVTSAGITAGISMTLSLVERLYGKEMRDRTIQILELE
ncbi:DJ-1/PfpI family protein [Shouchella lehensis]|uniref:DJ-1/PfpI domain-containing protein n=2 Tax=Shouchella lehensis TaxID=300825 RepID=A0A060LT52_9BACI|nr:DJ-1/PfpI family protein [Shouchella lehensis]AIC93317.1 hypothetical protein BleG1_0709 [Shouchella lehensis G1]MBG9782925.1 AraC family transcriptional regulator [Shouchella lehensis]TES49720.1 DJ-1/PfpI family protein [Shouchella lehensis]